MARQIKSNRLRSPAVNSQAEGFRAGGYGIIPMGDGKVFLTNPINEGMQLDEKKLVAKLKQLFKEEF